MADLDERNDLDEEEEEEAEEAEEEEAEIQVSVKLQGKSHERAQEDDGKVIERAANFDDLSPQSNDDKQSD